MTLAANPRPRRRALDAVARALSSVNKGIYQLGTGDDDTPLGGTFDCCGFATCFCYGIKRHRPGFNAGAHATVSDDINCNSSIEDALHARDLFEPIDMPELGALLKWPTIRVYTHKTLADGTSVPGDLLTFTGHESIVVGIDRAKGKWNPKKPNYALLDVVQCCGPNGRNPGILKTDGSAWNAHDAKWSKPEHRSWMLRVKP